MPRRRVTLATFGLLALVGLAIPPACATPGIGGRPIWKRIDEPSIAACGHCHPPGINDAEVQLFFKPLPLMPVSESFRIGRWTSRDR